MPVVPKPPLVPFSLAGAQGAEKQLGCVPFRTCLIVPAHDELQVVPYILKSLILGKEALSIAWDVLLLLDMQVLHLPQDGRELRDTTAAKGFVSNTACTSGSPRERKARTGVRDCWCSPCQHRPLC